MKKEHFLLICSVSVSLLVSLAIIRSQAPQLLGIPQDLQLVQLDKAVPPFFDSVFRQKNLSSTEYFIHDPLTRIRPKPFFSETLRFGPNDLIGFRNRHIPNIADIVVIGDSQTYGNNALLTQNWPSQMQAILESKQNTTYAMAAGGWCAVQYLDMFKNAMMFKPKVIVVAFYSGNDALESFQMAYGNPEWQKLIPDNNLTIDDIPNIKFPPPKSDWWRVEFDDGIETIFTPSLRLVSNQNSPTTIAGYAIMADVVYRIAELAEPNDIQLFFTIIPSKELVYAKKIKRDGLDAPKIYENLIRAETANIQWFRDRIQEIPRVNYVDTVTPMQDAALGNEALYLKDTNGHPIAAGYEQIAKAVADSISGILAPKPRGLYGIKINDQRYQIVLINDEGGWLFTSIDLVQANGWPEGQVSEILQSDFSRIPFQGFIDEVNKDRFGPS